jgi:hypothetical protein
MNSLIGLKKYNPSLVASDLSAITEARDRLGATIDQERKEDNLNDNQKEVMGQITNTDIETAIERLNANKHLSSKDLEDYILMRLSYPAPMINDLMQVLVVKNKNNLKRENSIYLPPRNNQAGVISIIDHKTSNVNNRRPIIRELSPTLTNDCKRLVNATKRIYLFENNKREPYTSSAFSHKLNSLFKRHLGAGFSSTTLRKIYLTGKYGHVLKEMKSDAQQMANSTGVQQSHYIDNNI